MSNSFGFGGSNASLMFGVPHERGHCSGQMQALGAWPRRGRPRALRTGAQARSACAVSRPTYAAATVVRRRNCCRHRTAPCRHDHQGVGGGRRRGTRATGLAADGVATVFSASSGDRQKLPRPCARCWRAPSAASRPHVSRTRCTTPRGLLAHRPARACAIDQPVRLRRQPGRRPAGGRRAVRDGACARCCWCRADVPYLEPLHGARPLPDSLGLALVLRHDRAIHACSQVARAHRPAGHRADRV